MSTSMVDVGNRPWRLDQSKYGNELSQQLKTSVPTMLALMTNVVPWMISIHFAGQLGSQELAAAALATTICNITGMSISEGLSSAMITLAGQARGELIAKKRVESVNDEEHRLLDGLSNASYHSTTATREQDKQESDTPLLPLVYLYRGLLVQITFLLPIGVWWVWFGAGSALESLGQKEELAFAASDFLSVLYLSLAGYSFYWALSSWLRALEIADTPAVASLLALILHIPCNLLFLYVLDWGILGVAWAIVVNRWVQALYTLLAMFVFPHGRQRILTNLGAANVGRKSLSLWREAKLAVSSPSGILQYLGLAVPAIIVISEWWASETAIFLAGRLQPSPSLALDGMAIYQSINVVCFMFPNGTGIAASARVGKFLGSDRPAEAALAAKVGVATSATLGSLFGLLLYFTPHTFFPSFFSPSKGVIRQASITIPFLALYVFADGIQITLNGIVTGCGRQCITMPIVVFAYWIVGLPLAFYIAFVRCHGVMCTSCSLCGIRGLVFGMTVGTWVHMILLAAVVTFTTNWAREVDKAKMRLETKQRFAPQGNQP